MSAAEKQRQIEQQELRRKAKNQMRAVVLFLTAVFLIFLILIPGKSVWYALHGFLLGMFGYCAILWPILLIYIAVLLSQEKTPHSLTSKIWQCAIFISLISAAVYIFKAPEESVAFFPTLKQMYLDGAARHAGGSGQNGVHLGAADADGSKQFVEHTRLRSGKNLVTHFTRIDRMP